MTLTGYGGTLNQRFYRDIPYNPCTSQRVHYLLEKCAEIPLPRFRIMQCIRPSS